VEKAALPGVLSADTELGHFDTIVRRPSQPQGGSSEGEALGLALSQWRPVSAVVSCKTGVLVLDVVQTQP
jgi:hypothetical protein